MEPLLPSNGIDEALDGGSQETPAYDDAPEPDISEDGMEGLPEFHDTSVSEPEIDWQLAGEALAAVTGPMPRGPVTREQGAKAEALLSEIGKAAQRFAKFGEFSAPKARKRPDFEAVWERIQEMPEAEADRLARGLAEPELIDAYGNAVNAARAAARGAWPVQIRETPTGPEWVEPGRMEGGRAADVLAALSDPLEMLESLQRGQLTPAQVMAVEMAYPELLNRIRAIYSNALAQQSGKRCPWAHEGQLRMLFNAPLKLVAFPLDDDQPKTKGSGEIKIDFETHRTKGQAIR